ncbi:MAG: hypothetical protein GC134_07985 [Proteobacteria bacterium]|nr:hypothetical protein [Pseudomonadota bacterium]
MTNDYTQQQMPDLGPYIDMLQSLHTPQEAAAIMRDYSSVLAELDLNAPAFDETLLPHSKEDIRKAFVYGFIVAQNDPRRKEHLQQGFVLIGRFQQLDRTLQDIANTIAAEVKALAEEVRVWDILIARMEQQQKSNAPLQ